MPYYIQTMPLKLIHNYPIVYEDEYRTGKAAIPYATRLAAMLALRRALRLQRSALSREIRALAVGIKKIQDEMNICREIKRQETARR